MGIGLTNEHSLEDKLLAVMHSQVTVIMLDVGTGSGASGASCVMVPSTHVAGW